MNYHAVAHIFEILYLLLIIGSVLVVIIENHEPHKTVIWLLVLLCLPGVGLVCYYLFGKDHRRRKMLADHDREKLDSLACKAVSDSVVTNVSAEYQPLAGIMGGCGKAMLLGGNDVEIYTDFSAMFESMLDAIESARHHVHIQFFKIEKDEVGERLAQLLVRKASEGVQVRLLYDSAANIFVDGRFYRKMKAGGVKVQSFLTVRFPFLDRDVNCRNHRKIVVVDGAVGFIGGMNIARRYRDGIHTGIWRDTHLKVTGPAVCGLQTAFLCDWRFAAKRLLDDPSFFPAIPQRGDILMQIVSSGPMDHWQAIMQGMVRIISMSRRYVYLQSPYFIPPEAILMAMKNAALAGVDVRLMIPEKGDKGIFPPLATMSFLEEILDAGVKVYLYTKGYMHAKMIVCDDLLCTVGSTNIDFRSLEQDFELNAFIYNPDFAMKMKEIFLSDERDCRLLDCDEWKRRPHWKRVKESVARIVSPLL